MNITMQLELPDLVAVAAKASGLLEPNLVATLIARELSWQTDQRNFFDLVREIRAQPGTPMTEAEIQLEVDALRAERSASEACN